jgi:hypothetical protein
MSASEQEDAPDDDVDHVGDYGKHQPPPGGNEELFVEPEFSQGWQMS